MNAQSEQPTYRWERPEQSESHWLYVRDDDAIAGEVWKEGNAWRLAIQVGPDPNVAFPPRLYFTQVAAQRAVEAAFR